MQNKRYFNNLDERINKLSYCAFIDVLGYKNMILESFHDNNSKRYFEEYYELISWLENEFLNHNKFVEPPLYTYKLFTDNFVLNYPFNANTYIEELKAFLIIIGQMQMRFLLSGVLLRGGIALGLIHSDDKVIVGPALIEAYELESIKAVYPRIIFSSRLKNQIDRRIEFFRNRVLIDSYDNYFLEDKDGILFLNYLYIAICCEDVGSDYDILAKHREFIISNIGITKDNHIFEKYNWLLEYHNYFCTLYSPVFQRDYSQFIVSKSSLNCSITMLVNKT